MNDHPYPDSKMCAIIDAFQEAVGPRKTIRALLAEAGVRILAIDDLADADKKSARANIMRVIELLRDPLRAAL